MALEEIRRRFADELASAVGLRTPGLREAFARVPRERFLDRGPWLEFRIDGYYSTADADPAQVYTDRSLALDVSRFINNSSPYLGAKMIDGLDLRQGDSVVQVGEMQKRIALAFEGGGARSVHSLRRDEHPHDATCWLQGDGFCLSTIAPPRPAAPNGNQRDCPVGCRRG